MTTEILGSNDFSRMAAARPAGPAPTITTSYSIDSRSGAASSLIDLPLFLALVTLFEAAARTVKNKRFARQGCSLAGGGQCRLATMVTDRRAAESLIAF